MSLVRQDEFKTILKQAVSEGKRIQLGYPSDYRSKSIEEADRRQIMTAQLNFNSRYHRNSGFQVQPSNAQLAYRKRQFDFELGALH